MKDRNGKTLAPFQVVAYNRSGDVELGEIVRIRKIPSRIIATFHHTEVQIKNLRDGLVSKVKNERGIAWVAERRLDWVRTFSELTP